MIKPSHTISFTISLFPQPYYIKKKYVQHIQTVVAFGGTGAQGIPIVKGMLTGFIHSVYTNFHSISNLRRLRRPSVNTRRGLPRATALAALPHVTIVPFSGYIDTDIRRVLAGADSTFVNTNGFAIGEKFEIYWGIRIDELAREAGVKHFIWATTDYSSKLGGFEHEFRCGHADRKGKASEFIMAQPTSPMAWSILHSGS
jgi:hypothetical protein